MSQPLPLMEHFYTIQGEGFNTGEPAYFLRLGGCDVGCKWCDVKDSWEAENHPKVAVKEMARFALESGAPNVVVTGGEPCMYELSDLCSAIQLNDQERWLETSGAHPVTGEWDWLVLSPKRSKACLKENYSKADELKVVIVRPKDFAWAEKEAEKVNPECLLYLQPEWDQQEVVMKEIIAYVKEHPKWRISLQTHKFMDIP
jgi:7-carboxy-7-deazaguanine synthase